MLALSALATHAGNDPYGDPLPPDGKYLVTGTAQATALV